MDCLFTEGTPNEALTTFSRDNLKPFLPVCSLHASSCACVFQQWGVSQSISKRRSVLMAHSAAWQKDVLFKAK